MNVSLAPGKYVVAVSGGVDSMALLDVLQKLPGLDLVVAHFEHGIRPDSDEDRKLVEAAAQKYGLPFVYERGNLGANASEAYARQLRYGFLRRVQLQHATQAIVTAHHQDDMLETAIFNMMRGTARKGLSSLRSHDGLTRPFLHIYKREILDYARGHGVKWREDSTNQDETYTRNYIRANIVPRLGDAGKKALLTHVLQAAISNAEIDALLDAFVVLEDGKMSRLQFILLPHSIAREVMATWLRQNGVHDFDRKLLERLVVVAKVALPGKTADVNGKLVLQVEKAFLKISARPLS